MSNFGKSIRVFLADGSPTGLRHVAIVNWSGQALACPRSRIPALANWVESKRPGVYLLLEKSATDLNTQAYIGESEDVFKRLGDHIDKKDFWNEVIIFTSKDENLTKSHVKYLEARLVEIAKQADRYKLDNGNTPTKSALPRADADAMEEFIENIKIILATLGHRILESVSVASTKTEPKDKTLLDYDFKFTVSKLEAKGKMTDDGFLLLKGSQLTKSSADSMRGNSATIKDHMATHGLLIDEGEFYLLVKDELLSSSSYAASIVAGSSRSGPQSWKTADGETLKDLEKRLLGNKSTK